MKILKLFLKGLVFTAGVLVAVWFFMPWQQIGEYALLSAVKAPASVSYSSVDNVSGGFVVNDLDVRNLMGMVNLSCRTLTIVPNPVASLLNLAPTCHIAFTGNVLGEVMVFRKKIPGVSFGDGGVVVSVGRREVLLENLRSNGEVAMRGVLALARDATDRVIAWSDVKMDVTSEAFEKELPSLQQALGLPLQQESPGHWLLRRDRQAARKEVQPAQ